jgi:AcrR family transcriptional regulator
MSSQTGAAVAVQPKRERGKQRVQELLAAGGAVFAEKGYDAATMTEIAARAGAPIGSLYQFFPSKESLADTLVQNYVSLLTADLQALEAQGQDLSTADLIEALFGVLRAHPNERAATLPLAEARMDERTRRETFRYVLRRHIASILRARSPALSAEAARDCAIVVLQLMKAASSLSDEESLSGRATAIRELQTMAVSVVTRGETGSK